jgi:hypothetical protein
LFGECSARGVGLAAELGPFVEGEVPQRAVGLHGDADGEPREREPWDRGEVRL